MKYEQCDVCGKPKESDCIQGFQTDTPTIYWRGGMVREPVLCKNMMPPEPQSGDHKPTITDYLLFAVLPIILMLFVGMVIH